VPIYLRNKKGQSMQMIDVIDGQPQYYITFNLGAAHITRACELWSGGNTGLNEEGEGYDQLGEWDGGKVRISHQEFTDQGVSAVSVMDGNHATSDHATHVAGTMVAAGVKAQAKGMAFKATLKSWEYSEVKVINLLGQVVYQSTLVGSSNGFIEMADFDAGLYLINLTIKAKGFTVKIVNQR